MFKIEKDIPAPPKTAYTMYPFGEMEIGDSFLCTGDEIVALRQAATQYGKRNNKKISTRKIEANSYRVWRIK